MRGRRGCRPSRVEPLGYWGYDLGRHLERLPSRAEDDLGLPEMYLGFYDWALAHDGATGRSWLVSSGMPDATSDMAEARAAEVMRRLSEKPQEALSPALHSPASLAVQLYAKVVYGCGETRKGVPGVRGRIPGKPFTAVPLPL